MNSELLSSINIPAIITSNNLTIMSMNAAALQYFKYYENELHDKCSSLLFSDDIKLSYIDYVKNIVDNNKNNGCETIFEGITKNKDILHFTIHVINCGNMILITIENINSIDAHYYNMFCEYESILSAIIVANDKLNILFANKEVFNVFGYTSSELVGNSITMLMSKKMADVHHTYTDKYFETGKKKLIGTRGRNVEGKHKNGDTLYFMLLVREIIKGNKKIFIASFENLTNATHTLHDKLREESKIKEEIKKRTSFLAIMSHELRTPINGIVGMISLMKLKEHDSTTNRYILTCSRSVDSLVNMLDDILLFNKAEAGLITLNIVSFDIAELVDDVITSSRINNIKNIELIGYVNVNVPDNIYGDVRYIKQILINLVDNAVKFTSTGYVLLEIDNISVDDILMLQFSITDTGIGMSEDEINKLFIPYMQLDSSSGRKYGGTGLGLSICNNLAKSMSSKITVTSKKNRGSVFTFSINLHINNSDHVRQPNNHLCNKNAIVVVKNSTCGVMINDVLCKFGARVNFFTNENDCINQIKMTQFENNKCDILIYDADIDNSQHVSILNNLYKYYSKLEIYIIVICHNKDIINAQHFPDVKYICKPVTYGQLTDVVLSYNSRNKINQISKRQSIASRIMNTIIKKPKSTKYNILIVDDDEINRDILFDILSTYNYDVTSLSNGPDCIETLMQNKSYNLLILDINMPGMNGIEVTNILHDKGISIPIVVFTADVNILYDNNASDCKFNDILLKPASVDSIINCVKKYIPDS
jgi:two-component system, sensor histidine kinase and response regulator